MRMRGSNSKMMARMSGLKKEMKQIGEEQKSIKEGQRQVKERFQDIMYECQKLRDETKMIFRQSDSTKMQLRLMFQILKARENKDSGKAAQLTSCLRSLNSPISHSHRK